MSVFFAGESTTAERDEATRDPIGVPVLAILAVLAGEGFVLADIDIPVVRPLVGAAVLVGVPTFVLARWSFWHFRDRVAARLFALGTTLLGILLGTLLLNTLLPFLGIARPLQLPAFVTVSTIADISLLAGAGRRGPGRSEVGRWLRRSLRARFSPDITLAALALVLAVGGAIRLNNGADGWMAVAAHVMAVAALAVSFLRPPRRHRHQWTIYLAAVALLLGTSLRGWFITGHDINLEYLSWVITARHQHWSMADFPSAYHACLSVNLLPQVFSTFLGIPAVAVFKVVAQLLFALVPVTVYVTGRRLFIPRVAFFGAAVFMLFPTFTTDMAYLTRQELAFLFVALAVLATCLDDVRPRTRQLLTFAFGVGVVVSHYSTTYLLIIMLTFTLIASRGLPLLERWRRERAAAHGRSWALRGRYRAARPRLSWSLAAPGVVLGLIISAWGWSTPITHSGGHLVDVVSNLSGALVEGKLVAGSSDLKFIGGGGPSAEDRFSDYYAAARELRDAEKGEYVVPPDSVDAAEPELLDPASVPPTAMGRDVADVGVDPAAVNAIARTLAGVVLELLLMLGVLGLVLRARSTRVVGREQFWLMLGSLVALAAIVVVPGLSADYGVLRAFQQTLILVAPLVGVGLWSIVDWLGRGAARAGALTIAVLGVVLTGAQSAALGDYPGSIAQANGGQYFQMLYVDQREMVAEQWLGAHLRGTGPQFVTTNGTVVMTRMETLLPESATVLDNFLPLLLQRGAYVVASPESVSYGRATVFHTGDLLTYAYPRDFLERRLSLIYSTGDTEIYR
ncbi:DUF2206 domain-containing protein [Nocardioides jejuensis]|uniref:DUF2206 domain-containing protein n=1 Tax=Nocardioides jejuensis TaxID=2502782 RepID=A0A4R1CI52_9ACTN|nr:DUF2206 domain-containing protein [Nocardioides jejuensis]TCJ30889.1 DUF2206 domain-containing protein [Nocardioides jejuensis]